MVQGRVISNSYAAFGRTRQKQRTRSALKVAAARLIEEGVRPSIDQVADAASVSRSTAYRYFSSREALEAEVMLDTAIRGELEHVDAVATSAPDAATRLRRVVRQDHQVVTTHEAVFRTALHAFVVATATQPGQLPPRPGNRLRYLAAAVEPLRTELGDQRIQQLVAGLAMCVGIESVVVTRDICGLDDTEAEELKQWMANALLQQAIRDAKEESDAP
jgi:AcrR family transcriptional regulator